MRRIVTNGRVDGEADDGPRRHPTLSVHARLAARPIPRVVVWPRRSTLCELLTVGERVRVKHPLPGLAWIDPGSVDLRVPDAAVVGIAIVQMLVLKKPGDTVALFAVVVIIGRSRLESSGAIIAAREGVEDVEACEADGNRICGQGDCVADVVGAARVGLAVREQGNGKITFSVRV